MTINRILAISLLIIWLAYFHTKDSEYNKYIEYVLIFFIGFLSQTLFSYLCVKKDD